MKKYISLILASLVIFSTLAGCTQGEVEISKEDAKLRTDIVIGDDRDAITMDPHKTTDAYSTRVFANIYDSLLKQTADLKLEPALAEKWEYISDTELIFNLRKDVLFHNGEKMTAKDVKFSLDRIVKEPTVRKKFDVITNTEIVDDYTVKLTLAEPSPDLLWNLGGTSASILCESYDSKLLNESPVGTGPMKLKEWRKNHNILMGQNEEYWKFKPKATSIQINIIPESSMRLIALRSGGIDFSQAVLPTNVGSVEGNKKLKSEQYLSQSFCYLSMNNNKAPFDNKLVRQAMNYGADKEAIVTMALEGQGKAINTVLAPDTLGADTENEYYKHDLDKAKKLLAEAGYPEGFEAKIYVAGDLESKTAQILQSTYYNMGVSLDITLVEYSTVLDYANNGDYELCLLNGGEPYGAYGTLHSLFGGASTAPEGNRSFYKNAQVDELLLKAKTEMNEKKRVEYFKNAQKIIMEDAPVIPLYARQNYYGANVNMEGYVIAQNGNNEFYNAYVKEKK